MSENLEEMAARWREREWNWRAALQMIAVAKNDAKKMREENDELLREFLEATTHTDLTIREVGEMLHMTTQGASKWFQRMGIQRTDQRPGRKPGRLLRDD